MSYYNDNDYRDYLAHHGILGQKWGKRNGPPYPLGYGDHSASEKRADWEKSVAKSKSINLTKWGRSSDKNILYLTGLSGSGKSTAAIGLAKKTNAEIIHLDSYLSPMSEESRQELHNKGFNKHLDQKVPEWRQMIVQDTGKLNYRIVDKFADAIESYGKEKYGQGQKVIVEGVQLFDNTLHEKRSFYSDKPYMCLTTPALTSLVRGNVRDEMNGLDFFYRIPMYMKTSKITSEAIKELELKGTTYAETNLLLNKKEGKSK